LGTDVIDHHQVFTPGLGEEAPAASSLQQQPPALEVRRDVVAEIGEIRAVVPAAADERRERAYGGETSGQTGPALREGLLLHRPAVRALRVSEGHAQ
jgi:hypothetical protein